MTNNYKATLTPNRRDIHTTTPKMLLVDIINLDTGKVFRDHAWIKSYKGLLKLKENSKKNTNIDIVFTAEEREYIGSNGPNVTLAHIRNISKSQ